MGITREGSGRYLAVLLFMLKFILALLLLYGFSRDPALTDPSLRQKLSDSRKEGLKRLEQVRLVLNCCLLS